jgi:hypothetical protein
MIENNIIDELGVVNKHIAELEAVARKLKEQLIARGVGEYEGVAFYAEVRHYDRATINPRLVRELADENFVSAVTEIKPIDSVTVKPFAMERI